MQVMAIRTGESIGDAVVPQLGKVGIGNSLSNHRNDVVAIEVIRPIVEFPARIDGHGYIATVAFRDERFTEIGPMCGNVSGFSVRKLRHCVPANDPAIRTKLRRHLLIHPVSDIAVHSLDWWSPAFRQQPAIDGAHHVANDFGTHDL
jgi:hypothetical protein